IGCAAALATIDVLTEPGFLDHVTARGEQLRAGLRELAGQHAVIADVRGPGLMVGLEFRNADTAQPDAARTAAVISHARTHGNLLVMNAGTWGNIIRFMPPLVVSQEEIDLALTAIQAALEATA
ncbi:MAG: aminotransferase class III-fold pyridoxal phosphate-dependent enzyme, partial [Actinobacteria bacterium]|nr:aminotransferase class III-fold pyridoxal phosphate-dependent enzyme [Actinomycetota bacterium]